MFGFPYGSSLSLSTPGFIPDNLDPLSKTKKYVELLLPEKEDRILMGEPGLINNSYMGSLMDFTSTDLEWFSAFIGLNKLAEKNLDLVQEHMLSNPKSVHSLCRWLHKTPFIGPERLIPYGDDEEEKRKVQTQPAFFSAMEAGAVGLLARLCTGSKVNTLIEILCAHKHFKFMIDRLVVFLQPPTSTSKLSQLSLAILQVLVRDESTVAALRANSSSVKNLQKLLSSSSVPSLQKAQAEQILSKLGSTSQPESEYENEKTTAKPQKTCASCGATDVPLSKCSACGKVRYCNRDHQRAHWKIHKPECKPKA